MAQSRAPKQWRLSKDESITSFESWKNNLKYILKLDPNFAPFLPNNVRWLKYSRNAPQRGFTDDDGDVPEGARQTAVEKAEMLDLMLGQVANWCPVISRDTIIQRSTSMASIWQLIRAHYGLQSTGAHFLDLAEFHLGPEEKPEDLFQRITSFVDDNLLKTEGGITHHGEDVAENEEVSPTVENLVVLLWLQMLHKDLPRHVKQRYCTDLRSRTLASLKPEISQALDSLLEELHTINEIRVMGSDASSTNKVQAQRQIPRRKTRCCPLCHAAKRKSTSHFLSRCPFLPEEDKLYWSKSRNILVEDTDHEVDIQSSTSSAGEISIVTSEKVLETIPEVSTVTIRHSPHLQLFSENNVPIHLTLDSGATASMIKESVAKSLGIRITPTSHTAFQADGLTPLPTVGEVHTSFKRDNREFVFNALVVKQLGSQVLAGMPFFIQNDICLRPAKSEITLSDGSVYRYSQDLEPSSSTIQILRATSTQVIWPGEHLELTLKDPSLHHSMLALEPRLSYRSGFLSMKSLWPNPQIISVVGDKIRIPNNSRIPQYVHKHDQFGQVLALFPDDVTLSPPLLAPTLHIPTQPCADPPVKVDPDRILDPEMRQQFEKIVQTYATVFDSSIGLYNGSCGPFQASVNMGPTEPPQRKGRIPQYSRNRLVELQLKFDELESQGVFQKPEDLGVDVEYVNPSFLVNKPNGGTRLVTAFADVAQYSKPQPSLMPDVDSTLRKIASWNYLILTDLTSAYYQIPLAKSSMKYCGVVTPFRGTRVYTRCAMGMPGSETALEELMCRILGDLLQDGCVVKLADDLYCGGSTPQEALNNWEKILNAIEPTGMRLSPHKTVICPRETMLLGWIWRQGQLSASKHRVSTLAICNPPKTVRGLRSFIGTYKIMSRVIPDCASLLAPLDDAVAGKDSVTALAWSDTLRDAFKAAQDHLKSVQTITLPTPADELWIVTDGSSKTHGLGATLYVIRNGITLLAGFFSAKLRQRQYTWIPCEIEALSISAALKHFGPYIMQSNHPVGVLTDSKPCVQAVEKLRRGTANLPSDFASRNAPECSVPSCQICRFIEDSVNEPVADCSDLRRTHSHLKQGTRPSKKATNVRDIKRYLKSVVIASDGLLVVRDHTPLAAARERIVVPRKVLPGILTALHIKLDHPSRYQMKQVVTRYFFALDLDDNIRSVCESCHTCLSLRNIPSAVSPQTTSSPPTAVGERFAADVLRRERQYILVVREEISSYTRALIVENERADTFRNALVMLCIDLRPVDGPNAVIRTDAAPGFASLKDDTILNSHHLSIEIGNPKNVNKNPVAERAIQELSREIMRVQPMRGPISPLTLSVATNALNSRIRSCGFSAREALMQRDQFTNQGLILDDKRLIADQHQRRESNHSPSEKAKTPTGRYRPVPQLSVGDVIYLHNDRKKHQCRDRYVVLSIDGVWCNIMKFAGNRLLPNSYRVRLSDCYRVPSEVTPSHSSHQNFDNFSDTETEDELDLTTHDTSGSPNIVEDPTPSEPESTYPPVILNEPIPFEPEPPTILTRPPELSEQPGSSFENKHGMTDQPSFIPRRSTRIRRPPTRLKDYVLYDD